MMMDGRARLDELCESLGDPYARGDRYAVFCGDALALMGRVEPDAFDLTVTSPPYNIGKEYEDTRPLEEYLDWCEQWMGDIYRITNPQGAFWLNVGYLSIPGKVKALPLPYLLWDRNPFFLVQEVVWNYGAGVAARKSLSPRNEKFLWYVKDPDAYTFNLDAIRDPDVKYPNQKKNKRLRCNTIGKNPSDVWRIAKVTSGRNRASAERAPHPAQFPLDLIDRVVLGFSNQEDLVLDPFLGSGTTAVSCVRNGRFVVGIEIQEAYCECAVNRIEAELQAEKSRLFVY